MVQLQLGVPELTRENYVQVLSEADSLLRLLQGYEQLLGGLNNYVMGVNELAGGVVVVYWEEWKVLMKV